MSQVRSVTAAPWPAYLLLLLGLLLQVGQHAFWSAPQVRMQQLPQAIPAPWLRVLSMGEPVVLAKLLMLWLQAFDYQAGVDLTLKDLDQQRLQSWLGAFLDLDPQGQYPLLMAVRFYANAPEPEQQLRFAAFAYQRFFADPNRRWPWLAHAAILTKHRLHNLPLALHYAHAIRLHATGSMVPSWAKQMELVILEEMGEWQQAAQLIADLLADGTKRDRREIHFLEEWLHFLNDCSAPMCKRKSYEP